MAEREAAGGAASGGEAAARGSVVVAAAKALEMQQMALAAKAEAASAKRKEQRDRREAQKQKVGNLEELMASAHASLEASGHAPPPAEAPLEELMVAAEAHLAFSMGDYSERGRAEAAAKMQAAQRGRASRRQLATTSPYGARTAEEQAELVTQVGKIQRSWRKKLGRRALAKMVRRAGRGSTVIAKAKALELQQAKLISAADAAESRRAERRASLEKQQAIHRAEKEAEKQQVQTLEEMMAAAQAMLERSSETESAPAPAPSTRPSQSQWLIGRPSEVPEAEEEEEGEDDFEDRWTGAKPPVRQSRFTIGNTRRQTIVEALADLEAGALGGQALNDLAVTRVQSVVRGNRARRESMEREGGKGGVTFGGIDRLSQMEGARRDSLERARRTVARSKTAGTPPRTPPLGRSPVPPRRAGTGMVASAPDLLAAARRSEVEEPFAYGGGAVRVATEEEQEAARRIQRKFHFAKGRQHLLAAVERATKGSRVVQRAKQFEMQQGRLTQIALNRGKSRRTIAPEQRATAQLSSLEELMAAAERQLAQSARSHESDSDEETPAVDAPAASDRDSSATPWEKVRQRHRTGSIVKLGARRGSAVSPLGRRSSLTITQRPSSLGEGGGSPASFLAHAAAAAGAPSSAESYASTAAAAIARDSAAARMQAVHRGRASRREAEAAQRTEGEQRGKTPAANPLSPRAGAAPEPAAALSPPRRASLPPRGRKFAPAAEPAAAAPVAAPAPSAVELVYSIRADAVRTATRGAPAPSAVELVYSIRADAVRTVPTVKTSAAALRLWHGLATALEELEATPPAARPPPPAPSADSSICTRCERWVRRCNCGLHQPPTVEATAAAEANAVKALHQRVWRPPQRRASRRRRRRRRRRPLRQRRRRPSGRRRRRRRRRRKSARLG